MPVDSHSKLRARVSHSQHFKIEKEEESRARSMPLKVLSSYNPPLKEPGESINRKPQHDHSVTSGQNKTSSRKSLRVIYFI